MDIALYLSPVDINKSEYSEFQLGKLVEIHTENNFPDLSNITIAILGVQENRRTSETIQCSKTSLFLRESFYKLYQHQSLVKTKIVDLGDIRAGATIEDTDFAMQEVCYFLIKRKIIPVVIGGSQDLTFNMYKSVKRLKELVRLLVVDYQIDFTLEENFEETFNNKTFLNKLILDNPNNLFNLTNLAYQSYYTHPSVIELNEKMNFDNIRLGVVRNNINDTEPLFRHANLVSFDLNAIKKSDFPVNYLPMPNGLSGDEACKLSRYAGINDELKAIGFFDFNKSKNNNQDVETSIELLSQMLWYFIDGVLHRNNEVPKSNSQKFTSYTVVLSDGAYDLTFYKSKITNRWWLSIPYPSNEGNKKDKHYVVPCTYEDYKKACNDDIPDVWIKTYQKLS